MFTKTFTHEHDFKLRHLRCTWKNTTPKMGGDYIVNLPDGETKNFSWRYIAAVLFMWNCEWKIIHVLIHVPTIWIWVDRKSRCGNLSVRIVFSYGEDKQFRKGARIIRRKWSGTTRKQDALHLIWYFSFGDAKVPAAHYGWQTDRRIGADSTRG